MAHAHVTHAPKYGTDNESACGRYVAAYVADRVKRINADNANCAWCALAEAKVARAYYASGTLHTFAHWRRIA